MTFDIDDFKRRECDFWTVLPELVDVQHGGEAPLVVVNGNQFVLIKDEEAETHLVVHAKLLLLSFASLKMSGYSELSDLEIQKVYVS